LLISVFAPQPALTRQELPSNIEQCEKELLLNRGKHTETGRQMGRCLIGIVFRIDCFLDLIRSSARET